MCFFIDKNTRIWGSIEEILIIQKVPFMCFIWISPSSKDTIYFLLHIHHDYCNSNILKKVNYCPGSLLSYLEHHKHRRKSLTRRANLLAFFLWIESVLISTAPSIPEPPTGLGLRIVVPFQHKISARSFFFGQLTDIFNNERRKDIIRARGWLSPVPGAEGLITGCWREKEKSEGETPHSSPSLTFPSVKWAL